VPSDQRRDAISSRSSVPSGASPWIVDPTKVRMDCGAVPFTLTNLKEDLEDIGSRFDVGSMRVVDLAAPFRRSLASDGSQRANHVNERIFDTAVRRRGKP
jgi:hypothetical protein